MQIQYEIRTTNAALEANRVLIGAFLPILGLLSCKFRRVLYWKLSIGNFPSLEVTSDSRKCEFRNVKFEMGKKTLSLVRNSKPKNPEQYKIRMVINMKFAS